MLRSLFMLFIFSLFSCEATEKEKIRDSQEAFEKMEFREEVAQKASDFVALNKLLVDNVDSMFTLIKGAKVISQLMTYETVKESIAPMPHANEILEIWDRIGQDLLRSISIKTLVTN